MKPRSSRRRPAFKNDVHRQLRSTCPTPLKLCFSTREQAEDVLSHTAHEGRAYSPHAVYHCMCGYWHWTSKEQY